MSTDVSPADPPSVEEVFALLEYVLSNARLRLRKEAKPIAFELVPTGDTWLFDPTAAGALFQRRADVRGEVGGDVLRVRCRPELLARLVTDASFTLTDDDDAVFEGQLEDLLLLVAAFEQSGNALGIRLQRKPQ